MDQGTSGKQPGITDVARLAGVSVTTVSRVLNGASQVSDRRRSSVLAAISELGYRPNEAARALVRGRQRMVGVLAANTDRYGFASSIRGIEEAARRRNMLVSITVVESEDPDDISSALDLVLSQPLTGIIGVAFERSVTVALDRLPPTMPVVAVTLAEDGHPDLPRTWIDDEQGGFIATSHLLDAGHETVHHLGFPNIAHRGRTAGYRRALESRGARVPEMVPCGWTPQDGRRAVLESLRGDDVTALFCFNDDMAMGAMRAFHELGRRVPEDVSVVGFDDTPLSAVWTPSLSSVRIDFQELGRSAFELLTGMHDGRGDLRAVVQLPPLFVQRESSAPPRR
ncbi:LacI family DNA-binding transcriptional regulator [Planctomonas deserti]|uniref:LacI family DNA-binding transcriptional regulator n=1 Tax=Planctomonas deserti TaxID=2144185 RepID=UPI000D37B3A2|nr:LacI family DNA-binding transcriptional regulator [Planctomonas deserti]